MANRINGQKARWSIGAILRGWGVSVTDGRTFAILESLSRLKNNQTYSILSLSNILAIPLSSVEAHFLRIGFILAATWPLFAAKHSVSTATRPGPRISKRNSVAISWFVFDLLSILSTVALGTFWAYASSTNFLRVEFVSRFTLLFVSFSTKLVFILFCFMNSGSTNKLLWNFKIKSSMNKNLPSAILFAYRAYF